LEQVPDLVLLNDKLPSAQMAVAPAALAAA
jgi:hypothetical protein